MDEWHRIMRKVLRHGQQRTDRTGVGTLALFGQMLTFDNTFGHFPAVTTKQLAFGQVCNELACFLQGYDSLKKFHSMGCRIWDGNGNSEYWKPRQRFEGDLGRIYGVQWRDWHSIDRHGNCVHVDQLKNLVDGMRREPHGRRHIVTALNPGEFDQMCLPPCHVLFQAFITDEDKVDLLVYMRSVDLFLGLPFDVASYAILQRLLAKELGLGSGYLNFATGDTHIYLNHIKQVNTVLSREVRPDPQLELELYTSLFRFKPEHAQLVEYAPHPAVPAPLNI
ncbi:MAG: thymidylate synthase [Gallionella sp.]|jgi:thymidylate synthase